MITINYKKTQRISKLANLTVLSLMVNSIEKINGLENMTNLVSIDLSSNKIKEVTYLDLSNNTLWDKDLENLKALKNNTNLTIDLSNNSI